MYFWDLQGISPQLTINSVHPPDHSVDLVLPVASISSLHKVCGLLVHATTGWWQLEGPQEVVGGLEVLSNCIDLMDEVLNTDDTVFAWRNKNALTTVQPDHTHSTEMSLVMTRAIYKFTAAWHNIHLKWIHKRTRTAACKAGDSFHSYAYLFLCNYTNFSIHLFSYVSLSLPQIQLC